MAFNLRLIVVMCKSQQILSGLLPNIRFIFFHLLPFLSHFLPSPLLLTSHPQIKIVHLDVLGHELGSNDF